MANGRFGGGDGSVENPFLIEDEKDLSAIRHKPAKTYRLVRNINLGIPPYSTVGWIPIDNFTGKLDGAGFKICNLRIDQPKENNIGLFSELYWSYEGEPMIHDLVIENACVSGRTGVGILAGSVKFENKLNSDTGEGKVMLARVYVSGKVSGSDSVGGLFGEGLHVFKYPNRNSILMKDIAANVSIRPGSIATKASMLIGSMEGSNGSIAVLRAVLNGACDTNKACENISAVWNKSGAVKTVLKTCFFDANKWLGDATDDSVALTTEEMTGRSSFEELEVEGVQNEHQTWKFLEGKVPELFFVKKDSFFLHSNNKFFTYENGEWVVKCQDALTCDDIQKGMDLKNLPLNAWMDAKNKLGNVELVDLIDNPIRVNIASSNKAMLRKKDAEKDSRKQKYSATFSFADFDCGISGFESL